MPSFEGRPILHVTDVKFAECKGRNFLCVEPHIDLRRNFNEEFSQNSITTFMSVSISTSINFIDDLVTKLFPFQTDKLHVNLGYVVNAGFTKRYGEHKDEHNQLALQVNRFPCGGSTKIKYFESRLKYR